MVKSEKDIENEILYYLNLQPGCFAFKYDVKGTWDPKRKFFRKVGKGVALGGADIIFILYGFFGCFEVKTPTSYKAFFSRPGDHELRQQAFLHQVRSKFGLAEVVCSLEMAIEHVEHFKNLIKAKLK